jgi:TonB family protein
MAPRVVLPVDVALRDLPASADRGLWRRCIALAGTALLHAAVLGALIWREPHAPLSPPEPIPVSLVLAPTAPEAPALEPPAADIPPPAVMTPPAPTSEAAAGPPPVEPAAPSRAETAPPETAPPAPAVAPPSASPEPSAAPAPGVAVSTPQTTEIAPPSPYLPPTPAQRQALDKSFFVGQGHYGTEMALEAINRSVRSPRAPPLTAAEREKLQKELHTGEHDNAGAPAREKEVNIAAARSKHAAPLSAEEWKTLDKLYRVGSKDRPTDDAAQAIQASALSLSIALADQKKEKELEAMYSVGRLSRSNAGPVPGGRTEARLVAQVTPDLPDGFGDRAFAFAVVARLSVAEDGAVGDVLLLEPTPEPDLNQALVVALQKWHFYPAVEAGKPVAASVEIRFTLSAPGASAAKAPKSS